MRIRSLSGPTTDAGEHIGERPGNRLLSLVACVLVDELVDEGRGGLGGPIHQREGSRALTVGRTLGLSVAQADE